MRGGVRAWPLALVVALSGCTQADGSPAPSTTDGPAPATVVLQIADVGGFVPAVYTATRLPSVTVYSDGRVLTPEPLPASPPVPALHPLQVHQVDESGGRRLVDLAVDAGVTATDDLGDPSITDLSTTRFELRTDTVSATRDVYGLGYGSVLPAPGASGLTPDQLAGRDRLSGLLAQLEDPASALGPDRVRGPEPYEPEAVAAVFTPFVQPSWDPVPPARPWPGPPLPGALDGPGLDCVLVTGDALGPVLDAAADATDRTPWTTSDGQRWTVVLRVLLPHENGCEDLPTR